MTVMIPMPQSDVDDLDAVVHALGVEDSHVTPAEAVAELHAEIERLRAALERISNERENNGNGLVMTAPALIAVKALQDV